MSRGKPVKKDAVTRFKCVRCGKVTAGRVPVRKTGGGVGPGDLSFRYPRRHYLFGGLICPGVFEEAEWVEVAWKDRLRTEGVAEL